MCLWVLFLNATALYNMYCHTKGGNEEVCHEFLCVCFLCLSDCGARPACSIVRRFWRLFLSANLAAQVPNNMVKVFLKAIRHACEYHPFIQRHKNTTAKHGFYKKNMQKTPSETNPTGNVLVQLGTSLFEPGTAPWQIHGSGEIIKSTLTKTNISLKK